MITKERWLQNSLLDIVPGRAVEAKINVGSTTPQVLEHITRLFPDIAKISYIIYDAAGSSDGEEIGYQQLQWFCIGTSINNQLFELSKKVTVQNPEPEEIEFPAVAIASKVILKNGNIFQIPMLDLCGYVDHEEAIELIKPFSSEGVLIKTSDRESFGITGYHIVGFNLIPEESYKLFLKYCRKVGEARGVIEGGYMDGMEKNGFSALRFDRVPGLKESIPVVERVF
jgi:hypothetical protein